MATGGVEHPEQELVADNRRASRGFGRTIPAAFFLLGAYILFLSVPDLVDIKSEPLGPIITSNLAGILHIISGIGMLHNGRRMRILAWLSTGILCAGPILIGLVELGVESFSHTRTPWGNFGQDYWYMPIILAIVGLVWLWWSNPRRIVELSGRAEQIASTTIRAHRND